MKLESRYMEGCEPFLKIGNNGIGLIFQHGATGTPASMKYAADYFVSRGYTVMAPTLAGHATDVNDLKRCNTDDFRTSLENAVYLMRSACDKVILCGLSMGSMMSSIVGSYTPIDGLVLMAGPANMKVTEPAVKITVDPGSKSPELNGWYKSELMMNWKVYNQQEMFSIVDPLMPEFMNLIEEAIPQISAPTCLIYSKGDKIVSYKVGESLYEQLITENKELHVLEHSGHVLTADGERDKVFEIIENFVKQKV